MRLPGDGAEDNEIVLTALGKSGEVDGKISSSPRACL
jgi:hypothetical protein